MILEVQNLSAAYGPINALRTASLCVEPGQRVALIGSNGAGKTTLLNCISGVVRPRVGMIRFEGKNLVGIPDYRIARLGLIQVPEGRRILGPMSVEENLLLGQLAAGPRATEHGLDAVYALFPVLAERRASAAGVLSGGQQQMLAIGRAMLGQPRLLLLDEPSLGLSPIMADTVFEGLAKLNQAGIAILLVEQNARRALQFADYAYVLDQGRIGRHGPGTELVHDPAVIDHYLGRPHAAARSHPG